MEWLIKPYISTKKEKRILNKIIEDMKIVFFRWKKKGLHIFKCSCSPGNVETNISTVYYIMYNNEIFNVDLWWWMDSSLLQLNKNHPKYFYSFLIFKYYAYEWWMYCIQKLEKLNFVLRWNDIPLLVRWKVGM